MYPLQTVYIHMYNTFPCRLCHHRLLYKYIHKTHHEWTAPVGIVSVYCHPLEHVVVNLMPVCAGPVLMGSHLSVVLLWYSLAILNTTVSHCGYHLPFLPSPEGHDFHHLKLVSTTHPAAVGSAVGRGCLLYICGWEHFQHPLILVELLGHLSIKDTFPHLKPHSCNIRTPLRNTFPSAPLVSGLEGFHFTKTGVCF